MRKRNGFLLCLIVVAFFIVGCSFGGDTKTSSSKSNRDEEKYLNLVIASEPPSLDPALAADAVSVVIVQNLFEGMTRINQDNKVENAVAKEIDVSEDGLTYTFHLKDAKWSNGTTITAEDFEYSWKRVLNPETLSEYAANLYVIKGAEEYNKNGGSSEGVSIIAKDDKTLEVVLNEPTAYFTQLTATHTYMPVNKEIVEENNNWAADSGDSFVSNGAFYLKTWKHDDTVLIKKNTKYWGSDDVELDKVTMRMVEDESTANKMFEAGEIDFLGAPFQKVPLDAVEGYKASGELNAQNSAAVYYYKVNTTKEFVSNKNIRKALALAIDRDNIVTNITKAGEKIAMGTVPPAITGFEDANNYFKDNDINEAKKYLALGMEEQGLTDPSEITVDISINTSETHAAIAQVVQENWKKNLGINSNIDNSEWKVYLDKLHALDYPGVGRLGWVADYLDAVTFLDMYDTKDNGNNDTGWENAEFKNLIDESRKETDEKKRIEILKDSEAVLMDDMPIIPIYYFVDTNVMKDYVSNMVPNGLSNIDLKVVDVNR